MAASRSLSAATVGLDLRFLRILQLLFVIVPTRPDRALRVGSASTSAWLKPNFVSEGPIAR